MEILEIRAASDLRVRAPGARPAGAHTYHINCRQFSTVHHAWQNDRAQRAHPLGIMTLDFQYIWMMPAESAQIAAAIKELTPQLTLSENPPTEVASAPL